MAQNPQEEPVQPPDWLIEPAPAAVPIHPRQHVNDGLDNSDLRLLLDLATAQAKGKE